MLPLDVTDLTAQWFSTALELDVTSVTVLDQSSGTTGRAQVALTGGLGVPATAFVWASTWCVTTWCPATFQSVHRSADRPRSKPRT